MNRQGFVCQPRKNQRSLNQQYQEIQQYGYHVEPLMERERIPNYHPQNRPTWEENNYPEGNNCEPYVNYGRPYERPMQRPPYNPNPRRDFNNDARGRRRRPRHHLDDVYLPNYDEDSPPRNEGRYPNRGGGSRWNRRCLIPTAPSEARRNVPGSASECPSNLSASSPVYPKLDDELSAAKPQEAASGEPCKPKNDVHIRPKPCEEPVNQLSTSTSLEPKSEETKNCTNDEKKAHFQSDEITSSSECGRNNAQSEESIVIHCDDPIITKSNSLLEVEQSSKSSLSVVSMDLESDVETVCLDEADHIVPSNGSIDSEEALTAGKKLAETKAGDNRLLAPNPPKAERKGGTQAVNFNKLVDGGKQPLKKSIPNEAEVKRRKRYPCHNRKHSTHVAVEKKRELKDPRLGTPRTAESPVDLILLHWETDSPEKENKNVEERELKVDCNVKHPLGEDKNEERVKKLKTEAKQTDAQQEDPRLKAKLYHMNQKQRVGTPKQDRNSDNFCSKKPDANKIKIPQAESNKKEIERRKQNAKMMMKHQQNLKSKKQNVDNNGIAQLYRKNFNPKSSCTEISNYNKQEPRYKRIKERVSFKKVTPKVKVSASKDPATPKPKFGSFRKEMMKKDLGSPNPKYGQVRKDSAKIKSRSLVCKRNFFELKKHIRRPFSRLKYCCHVEIYRGECDRDAIKSRSSSPNLLNLIDTKKSYLVNMQQKEESPDKQNVVGINIPEKRPNTLEQIKKIVTTDLYPQDEISQEWQFLAERAKQTSDTITARKQILEKPSEKPGQPEKQEHQKKFNASTITNVTDDKRNKKVLYSTEIKRMGPDKPLNIIKARFDPTQDKTSAEKGSSRPAKVIYKQNKFEVPGMKKVPSEAPLNQDHKFTELFGDDLSDMLSSEKGKRAKPKHSPEVKNLSDSKQKEVPENKVKTGLKRRGSIAHEDSHVKPQKILKRRSTTSCLTSSDHTGYTEENAAKQTVKHHQLEKVKDHHPNPTTQTSYDSLATTVNTLLNEDIRMPRNNDRLLRAPVSETVELISAEIKRASSSFLHLQEAEALNSSEDILKILDESQISIIEESIEIVATETAANQLDKSKSTDAKSKEKDKVAESNNRKLVIETATSADKPCDNTFDVMDEDVADSPCNSNGCRSLTINSTYFALPDVLPGEILEKTDVLPVKHLKYQRANSVLVEEELVQHDRWEYNVQIVEPFIDLTGDDDPHEDFRNVAIDNVSTQVSTRVEVKTEESLDDEMVVQIRIVQDPLQSKEIKQEIITLNELLNDIKQEDFVGEPVLKNAVSFKLEEEFTEEIVGQIPERNSESFSAVSSIVPEHLSKNPAAQQVEVLTPLRVQQITQIKNNPGIVKVSPVVAAKVKPDIQQEKLPLQAQQITPNNNNRANIVKTAPAAMVQGIPDKQQVNQLPPLKLQQTKRQNKNSPEVARAAPAAKKQGNPDNQQVKLPTQIPAQQMAQNNKNNPDTVRATQVNPAIQQVKFVAPFQAQHIINANRVSVESVRAAPAITTQVNTPPTQPDIRIPPNPMSTGPQSYQSITNEMLQFQFDIDLFYKQFTEHVFDTLRAYIPMHLAYCRAFKVICETFAKYPNPYYNLNTEETIIARIVRDKQVQFGHCLLVIAKLLPATLGGFKFPEFVESLHDSLIKMDLLVNKKAVIGYLMLLVRIHEGEYDKHEGSLRFKKHVEGYHNKLNKKTDPPIITMEQIKLVQQQIQFYLMLARNISRNLLAQNPVPSRPNVSPKPVPAPRLPTLNRSPQARSNFNAGRSTNTQAQQKPNNWPPGPLPAISRIQQTAPSLLPSMPILPSSSTANCPNITICNRQLPFNGTQAPRNETSSNPKVANFDLSTRIGPSQASQRLGSTAVQQPEFINTSLQRNSLCNPLVRNAVMPNANYRPLVRGAAATDVVNPSKEPSNVVHPQDKSSTIKNNPSVQRSLQTRLSPGIAVKNVSTLNSNAVNQNLSASNLLRSILAAPTTSQDVQPIASAAQPTTPTVQPITPIAPPITAAIRPKTPQVAAVKEAAQTNASVETPEAMKDVTPKEEVSEDGDIIDLTWIDDLADEEDCDSDPFLYVKVESLTEDPVPISPGDSGIESPPIQMEYPEHLLDNRLCLCGRIAEYLCECNRVMYCSQQCQLTDWNKHRKICPSALNQ